MTAATGRSAALRAADTAGWGAVCLIMAAAFAAGCAAGAVLAIAGPGKAVRELRKEAGAR